MSSVGERPALYGFIQDIVNESRGIREGMTYADRESVIGPAVCRTLVDMINVTLSGLADDITDKFDHGPEYSALVAEIADHARKFLYLREGISEDGQAS